MFDRIFRRKSLELLNAEMQGEKRLHRVLGPISLTSLGVGAIIGAGIFAMTGRVAAQDAGPAVMTSFMVAGVACVLAALCYSEFAAMVPVAGSAYTYTYATLGELAAWIIGWDLILEYAVGSMTVAIGWSGYMQKMLHTFFDISLPVWMTGSPGTFEGSIINLPAVGIVLLIMVLLVVGVRESARFNALMVAIKLLVVLFFIFMGFSHVDTANWTPFMPYGFSGVMSAAAVVFFAYIGFDAVSTTAEEARNPKRDLPIGIIASLVICTVLYLAVCLVLSGTILALKLRYRNR